MKNVLKKIGSVLIDILIVIVFIISTLVVIASVTANRTGGQPSVMGYVFSSVQTDSMQGTINKGDFVVGKLVDSNTKINVGDIISFKGYHNGKEITITHRVVEILDPDTDPGYITQGDNEQYSDSIIKVPNDVLSVYQFRIPFVGSFIDFLKTPFGFIICLVLPLLAFISFQAYKLITLYLRAKKLELVEEANNIANSAKIENNSNNENNSKPELSEEEKNAIIAEYLAKQALEKEKAEKASADDDKTDVAEEDPETERESEVEAELEVEESTEAEEENEAEESDEKN